MKDTFRLLFVYGWALLMLSSCTSQSRIDDGGEMPAKILPLSCIAVLPANTSADLDETISYAKAQSLEKGAAYATEVIDRLLRGNPKVRIINSFQVDARRFSSDAILWITFNGLAGSVHSAGSG